MSIETPIVLPLAQPEPSTETSGAPLDPVPPARVSGPVTTERVLAGDWLFVPSPGTGNRESYPPEYIELRLTENSGVLQGRYRARYRIGNRAISPTVAFEFAGPASGGRASLSWTGSGGARGDIELRLLADGALEVIWTARSLGTELGLISGSAVLIRKVE